MNLAPEPAQQAAQAAALDTLDALVAATSEPAAGKFRDALARLLGLPVPATAADWRRLRDEAGDGWVLDAAARPGADWLALQQALDAGEGVAPSLRRVLDALDRLEAAPADAAARAALRQAWAAPLAPALRQAVQGEDVAMQRDARWQRHCAMVQAPWRPDCATLPSRRQRHACLAQFLVLADQRLALAEDGVRTRLAAVAADDPAPRDPPLAAFEAAQSAWRDWREAQCRFEAAQWQDGWAGPGERLACGVRLGWQRVFALMALDGDSGADQ